MRTLTRTALALLALSALAAAAPAQQPPAKGWYTLTNQPGGYRYGYGTLTAQGVVVEQYSSVNPYQAAQPAVAPPPATYGGSDPYGFLAWLNSTRAQYGLPAVGYDPNLEAWASQNNAQQNARGIGHFVTGPARRQNAAMGAFAQVPSMWMQSPAHRAALLDPSIRMIGLAGAGAYWTFNAY